MNLLKVPPQQNIQDQWKLTSARIDEWLQHELLTWNWWLLLILFSITTIVWWKKTDKTRLSELSLYTAIIILFVIVLDELGEELSLWYYTVDIIPLFPPLTAIDITCLPLVYALIYQRFSSWKSFSIATLVMAIIFCFIMEPLFVWIGVYVMLIWKSYYGLPIYIAIALITKLIVSKTRPASNTAQALSKH